MSYEVCFYAGSSPPCCFVPAGLSRWLERARRPVSRDLGTGPENGRPACSAACTRPVFGKRLGVGWDGPGDPPHGRRPVSRDLGPGPENGRPACSAACTRPVFGKRLGVGWDGPGDPPHGPKPRPKLGIRLLLGACCWTGSRKLVYPTAE